MKKDYIGQKIKQSVSLHGGANSSPINNITDIGNNIDQKINQDKKIYVFFYSESCGYSMRAYRTLKESGARYCGYLIKDIPKSINKNEYLAEQEGMTILLNYLIKYAKEYDFDVKHKTKPIVFYDGKFIGGCTELIEHLRKNPSATQ